MSKTEGTSAPRVEMLRPGRNCSTMAEVRCLAASLALLLAAHGVADGRAARTRPLRGEPLRRRAALARCFSLAQETPPRKLTVEVCTDGAGRVAEASLARGTELEEQPRECVLQEVRSWSFPRQPRERIVVPVIFL
jgi:hypothetical protein